MDLTAEFDWTLEGAQLHNEACPARFVLLDFVLNLRSWQGDQKTRIRGKRIEHLNLSNASAKVCRQPAKSLRGTVDHLARSHLRHLRSGHQVRSCLGVDGPYNCQCAPKERGGEATPDSKLVGLLGITGCEANKANAAFHLRSWFLLADARGIRGRINLGRTGNEKWGVYAVDPSVPAVCAIPLARLELLVTDAHNLKH